MPPKPTPKLTPKQREEKWNAVIERWDQLPIDEQFQKDREWNSGNPRVIKRRADDVRKDKTIQRGRQYPHTPFPLKADWEYAFKQSDRYDERTREHRKNFLREIRNKMRLRTLTRPEYLEFLKRMRQWRVIDEERYRELEEWVTSAYE